LIRGGRVNWFSANPWLSLMANRVFRLALVTG